MVLFLTLLPSNALPETPEWELLSFDTFCHAATFALLTFLVIRSFYFHYGNPRFLRYAIGVSLTLSLFLGILIELLQMVMKMGRHGEISDEVSDLIGSVAGAAFFYYLSRRNLVF